MKKVISYSLQDVSAVAKQLKEYFNTCAVITFTGPLGAGKTTLVKELLKQCGVTDMVTSPTFTYMNQYENKNNERFYHFDLYRIKDINDFLQAGFDEYLYRPNSWTLIEWPEYIMPLLKERVCHIAIEYDDTGENRILNIVQK